MSAAWLSFWIEVLVGWFSIPTTSAVIIQGKKQKQKNNPHTFFDVQMCVSLHTRQFTAYKTVSVSALSKIGYFLVTFFK